VHKRHARINLGVQFLPRRLAFFELDPRVIDSKPLCVLVAEDNPADVFLIREALTGRFPDVEIVVQEDGEQMMHWIDEAERGATPCPDVILLDLNLPRISGEEALWKLRRSGICSDVPAVIVTSSDSPRDRKATASLGANHYFRKPTDLDEFMKLADLVGDILSSKQEIL
jgi:chemotaxis family two-component system response regulator Rcp1